MISLPLIAVDIGSSSIKVIETSNSKKTKLKKIGIEVLPEGIFVDGRIEKYDALGELIKGLIKRSKIQTAGKRVAVSVSGDEVLIKKVFIPDIDDTDLHDTIEVEAEQNFHADLSELYWEYKILDDYPRPEGHKAVLLVAAAREVVDQKLEIVHSMGMKAGVIDCDMFSILNIFETNYAKTEGLSAVINVGSRCSQAIFVKDGHFIAGRSFACGGQMFSNNLETDLSVDYVTAETLKISASLGSSNIPSQCLESLANSSGEFIEQFNQVLEDFQAEEPDYGEMPFENIYLSGGGAQTLGLDSALAAKYNTQVHIMDPFLNINTNGLKGEQAELLQHSNLFGVASGLSLRNINDSED